MKKFFTLLTLLLCAVTSSWGADYTVTATRSITNSNKTSTWSAITANSGNYFQSEKTALGEGLYFVAKAKITLDGGNSLNVKENGEMYIEVPNASSAGTVKFTNGANNRYMQTESGGKVHMKGDSDNSDMKAQLAFTSTDIVDVGGVKYLKLTSKSDCKFQTVSITLTSSDSYVSLTKLSNPTITYVAATGTVTIGSVTNASKVTYTTDGTDPTASSTTYSSSFDVADGTVVKAIAIGDGVSYSNSDVASETVLRTGIKLATPVIKKFNGAVAITCTNPNATIKYSTNGGSTYNTYSRPFTLSADATVLVHAERTSCTNSDDTSEDVSVVATNKTKTIYLDYDDFTISTYTATGKTATDAYGYILTIDNTDKSWSSNSINITTPGGIKKEFKLSNGAQNTLTIPAGIHVTKLTIYSIVNKAKASAAVSGWKEVGGVDYQSGSNDYKNVPMGAFTDVDDYNTNPDVRVYDINQTSGTITFTNAGEQLCFVIALDIIEDATTITPAKEYTTYVTPTDLDFTTADKLTAYIATAANSTSVTMTPINKVPAGTPVVLKATETGSGIDVSVAATTDDVSANKLKVSNGVSSIGGTGVWDYILSNGVFYHASAGVLPAGKCYLHLDSEPSGARELTMSFEDETTGIQSIENGKLTIDNSVYDLLGRKVAQPTKGLYIVNGKKVVIK